MVFGLFSVKARENVQHGLSGLLACVRDDPKLSQVSLTCDKRSRKGVRRNRYILQSSLVLANLRQFMSDPPYGCEVPN